VFLEHALGDTEAQKQDCELRGFVRLSDRLKIWFPRLPIRLLLDGLYANGPVMQRCRDLPLAVHDRAQGPGFVHRLAGVPHAPCPEATGLPAELGKTPTALHLGQRHRLCLRSERASPHLKLHVVVCEEIWERIDERARTVTETSLHAWLSSQPLSREKVHARCNLGARYRWGIEAGFLVEKRQGYHYEHAFALDWNAMRGYHLLMRLAHGFNTLARFTRQLRSLYQELGVRGAIRFIRSSCAAPWLDPARMRVLLAEPFLLQLE
jgi:hypothetical protein